MGFEKQTGRQPTEQELQALAALGYVAGSPEQLAENAGSGLDPKDMVEVAEAWTMKYLAEGRTKPTVKELVSLIEARLALDGMLDEESDETEPPVDFHMVLVDRDK